MKNKQKHDNTADDCATWIAEINRSGHKDILDAIVTDKEQRYVFQETKYRFQYILHN